MKRSELMYAVWMHSVHCQFRNKGWPTLREELDEAVTAFRQAEALGLNIPSIDQACAYYNGRA